MICGFEYREQLITDLLRAIQTVKPIIGMLRKLQKNEEELKTIDESIIRLETRIESYKKIFLFIKVSNESKKLFEDEMNKYTQEISELRKRKEEIKEEQPDLNEEVVQYMYYTDYFNWVNEFIAAELFSRISAKEDIVIATFLLLNNGISDENYQEIRNVLNQIIQIPGLQAALLQAEKDRQPIIDYISATDL